ncbi:hypothetical protein NDN95_19395 [Burkholderia glumae]|nr:hypothetical protein [Burkholderia glumae]MCM2494262.1 hypothetical protein [Burkholderia glumae]
MARLLCRVKRIFARYFPAALRCQQQRSEIMINVSQRVNYFFARRDPLIR